MPALLVRCSRGPEPTYTTALTTPLECKPFQPITTFLPRGVCN
jgi:hypothetical protein